MIGECIEIVLYSQTIYIATTLNDCPDFKDTMGIPVIASVMYYVVLGIFIASDRKEFKDLEYELAIIDISQLVKMPYSRAQIPWCVECAICLDEFADGDAVTPLHCDVRHQFHTECITRTLDQINKHCPLCRMQITFK